VKNQMVQNKQSVAAMMRIRAATGLFDGTDLTFPYLETCRYVHRHTGTTLIFTRDTGHHTSGWWKNPDYERCLHLSLSFIGIQGNEVFQLPRSSRLSHEWIDAFFGEDKRFLWIEGSYSALGKSSDVWHYRLFCDPTWDPIRPTGEVYSQKNTPAGFLSFSDLQYLKQKSRDRSENPTRLGRLSPS